MRNLLPVVALGLFAACRRPGTSEPARPVDRPVVTDAAPAGDAAVATSRVILRPTGRPVVEVGVEVQRTMQERERGLMFRRNLDPMAGMLFVFRRPEQQTFWMRNTLLPLDMIFITSDQRVLGVVANATPQTDTPRSVPGESMYVLEVNAGFAERHGIRAGTPVSFENVPVATE